MSLVVDILVALMLVISGIFGLLGSWGLIKLPDTMTRLHTPTKSSTLGVGGILIASMLFFAAQGDAWGHELLITLFLLLTAPISALVIARSVIYRHLGPQDLPPTEDGAPWATYDSASGSDARQPRPHPPAAD